MTQENLYDKLERGYSLTERNGISILRNDVFSCIEGIDHGFSTRMGGVSPAPYTSLNLSLTRDDNRQNVLRNYSILFEAAEMDINTAVLINHEHGANVLRVDRSNMGQGLFNDPLPFCDCIITNDPEVVLVTLHADCGCVYLFDPEHRAIGLAHAGWKGTYNRIAQRMCEKMEHEFESDPEYLIAAFGPSICKNCFEVDENIADDFVREFNCSALKKTGKPGKAYVNIEMSLLLQLMDAGMKPKNISSMGLCTFEREDILYSYRRDKGKTGAMIGFLRLID